MTTISLLMLCSFLTLCPCNLQVTPITQDSCALSWIVPGTARTSAHHDCRSEILESAWHVTSEATRPGKRIAKQGKRFITVTEAVLGHTVPSWWRREVRRGVAGMESEVWFTSRQLKNLWHEDEGELFFSGVDELSPGKDGLYVELDGTSVLLPMRSLEGELGSTSLAHAGDFAICLTENSVAVALFCPTKGFGNPRSVICFDRKSGMLKWSRKLDQHVVGFIGSSGGPTFAYTEIIATDTTFAVFSACQMAVSLQCFDITSGEKELTFVSNKKQSQSKREK